MIAAIFGKTLLWVVYQEDFHGLVPLPMHERAKLMYSALLVNQCLAGRIFPIKRIGLILVGNKDEVHIKELP